MFEKVYVLIEKDDVKKSLILAEKIFAFNSDEAQKAKKELQEIVKFAKANGYSVSATGGYVEKIPKAKKGLQELRERYVTRPQNPQTSITSRNGAKKR